MVNSIFEMKMFKWLGIKLIRRAARKELTRQSKRKVSKPEHIRKIGVLIDTKNSVHSEEIQKELAASSYAEASITFFQYDERIKENSDTGSGFFGPSDFNFAGVPSAKVQKFCATKFDLLINYFTENNPYLQLISLRSKSNFRVGFSEVDSQLNDLIFAVPQTEPQLFCAQMNTYLNYITNK